jgi:MFS family permease
LQFARPNRLDRRPFLAHSSVVQPDSVIRHPPFAFFWCARVLSSFAYQMQAVAIGWQVYALTSSAFDLGLVGLAQFVPVVLLTLVAGHTADRYDRRRIVQLCQAVECMASLTLATGTAFGWLGVHGIFGIVALVGAARAFEAPTLSALMPGLVSRASLSQASAWSASANQTASIVGPAFGGVLYAVGAPVPFACVAGLYLLAILFVALIRIEHVPPAREPISLQSVFLGIVFIRHNPAILGAISLDLFAVLLGGATALLPIFARDILHTGSWGLGLLRASPAVGALTMSVLLAHRPLRRRAGHIMFGAVIVFGMATIVFALSHSILLSVAALGVLGAADVVSVVVRYSLVQSNTPDTMRGRVSAVNTLFIGTSNQLGEFESGMAAAALGTVPATVLGGVGTIVVALLWMRWFPALREVDSLAAK